MTNSSVKILDSIPIPPDLDRHVKLDYKLEDIWQWIGSKMFYNKILGYRGPFDIDVENKVDKAVKLYNDVEEVKKFVLDQRTSLMTPKTVYQFFKCSKKDETIFIYNNFNNEEEKEVIASFSFPRQVGKSNLCLSDYIHPELDYIGMFANSSGELVSEEAEKLREEGEYKNSFILQALGLATAEALAELLHYDIRAMWGFKDPDSLTMSDVMLGRYQGSRYSFGYPACPNLEDQEILWKLLRPDEIGIGLTDGYMMDPEASVSAIVFHHPEAKYFSV
jgi:5-methyltetrahydrofolate--homocysteine methyltransferase